MSPPDSTYRLSNSPMSDVGLSDVTDVVLCFRQRSTQQITQPCDPHREDVELYKHSPDDMKEPQGLQGIKGSQGLQGLDEDRKSDSDASQDDAT